MLSRPGRHVVTITEISLQSASYLAVRLAAETGRESDAAPVSDSVSPRRQRPRWPPPPWEWPPLLIDPVAACGAMLTDGLELEADGMLWIFGGLGRQKWLGWI